MRGGVTMDRVILIKYGELSTKKGNRNFFINTLYNSDRIMKSLSPLFYYNHGTKQNHY